MNLKECKQRIVAIGVEALANLSPAVTAYGYPYIVVTPNQFPMFMATHGGEVFGSDYDVTLDTYTITLRLLIGKITEGYTGDIEDDLDNYIPKIRQWFANNRGLTSDSYTTRLTDLLDARLANVSALRTYDDNSTPAIGVDFSIICQFVISASQDHL